MAFAPVPFLVALRGLGQGCHITNGQTWTVGIGTALRLSSMAVFVFGFAVPWGLSGPVLGGGMFLVGIGAETVYVLAMLYNKPQWTTRSDAPTLSLRQYFHYAGPLMVGSLFNQMANPIFVYMLNRGMSPGDNGAAYDLIRDTAWVLFSTLMIVQPVIVRHATSSENLRVIMRFMYYLVAGILIAAVALAASPLRDAIFIKLMQLDKPEIRNLTYAALLCLIPMPLIHLLNLATAAMHTRSGHTIWVTAGNAVAVVGLSIVALMMDFSAYNGVIVAVIAWASFNLTIAIIQAVGLIITGLEAVVHPGTLAERLHDRRHSTVRTPISENRA